MPVLHVRKPNEAPPPSRSSRAVREQQQKYDDFVRKIDTSEVGDLELEPNENLRSVKVRLRRASSRLGLDIDSEIDVAAAGAVQFAHDAVAVEHRPRLQ